MNESAQGLDSLPHTVFLRRLAGATRGTSIDARLGRAAFLVLRLIDLLAPDERPLVPDAFNYQHAATARACRGLPADRPETSHLIGVVQSTADAYHTQDVGLLFPALFAYAHYLEDELRLEEALDVLETVERVSGEALRAEDRVAARLRTARVLRKLNRFDPADRAYEEAGALAAAVGDKHCELLSRIGRVYTVTARGNLGDADVSLRAILADAQSAGDQDAQALAHQGMAVVFGARGQPAEGIPHLWRAFELHADEPSRTRALADLGASLAMVGDIDGAERALGEVVRRGDSEEAVSNALIELMSCASFRRDRVGFERWKERCEARRASMPPNVLADFYLRFAIGKARFGLFERAEELLDVALAIAQDRHLHELEFRIQRIKGGIRECRCETARPLEDGMVPTFASDAAQEVWAGLAQLQP